MLHNHLSSLFQDEEQQQQQQQRDDHHREDGVLLSSASAAAQMGFFSSYPAHPSGGNSLNFPLLVAATHPHNINNPFSLYKSSSSSSPKNPTHLSLQKYTSNNRVWGGENDDEGDDDDHYPLRISAMKMKKIKQSSRRKIREPRFCFKTLSDVDVLDDGYKWRKYGQKVVKNTQHPRSYYRCSQGNCRVKKRVERLAEDPRMVITTYEGRHAHSPSHDLDDSDASHGLSNFFW